MKSARVADIKAIVERFDALPDGAFLAALAEHGVDADDLVAYSREMEKQERALRKVRRGVR